MEWISVKDRIPNDEIPVLVTYKSFVNDELLSDMIAAKSKGKWYWWDGTPLCISDEVLVEITHWMPLPEPPKGE